MPARTIGPEPSRQFSGNVLPGTECQYGSYLRGMTSAMGGNCPNFVKQGDFWPHAYWQTAADSAYMPSSAMTYNVKVTYNGVPGLPGQIFFGNDQLENILNVGGSAYLAWLHGTYIPLLLASGQLSRTLTPWGWYLWTMDGFTSNFGALGTMVGGNFRRNVTVDSPFPQTRSAWYAGWSAYFKYAVDHSSPIRFSPHIGSLEDWSAFQTIFEFCPCMLREWFTLSDSSSFNAQAYNELLALYWFANEAPPVFPGDPPTRIVDYGIKVDNGDIHTALALYCMQRGPNTWFSCLGPTAQTAMNPAIWLPTANWLGPGTSAPVPVVGGGGGKLGLLMRTFAGGITYANFTGSPQLVTLPAGFTDWNGRPVTTATIGRSKGDVFLAPTSGAVPGSGGGGGGTGGGTGGGPPPPPPPPVASATNTCCITITAPGGGGGPPISPGTPNLYLALIGVADVTGTALALAGTMTDGAHVVGLDSTDFAFLGSPIMIYGAGLGGTPFWTTIAAITDSLHATLADAVPTDVVGKEVDCYFPVIQDPTAVLFHYYVLIGTYDMHSSLSTRPTLNFEIRTYPVNDSGQLYVPNVGMPVLLIIEGYGDVFGGSIDQVAAENTPGQIPVVSKCQCVSWDQVLTKRLLMLTGAFPTGTNRDPFTGDGTKAIFVLSAPPVGIVSVTLNGVPQTFGINSTLAYLSWNVDSTTVTIFGAPPAAGAILVVTYQAAGVTIAPPGYLNQTADQIFFALIQTIALQEGLAAIAVPGPVVDQIGFESADTVDSALKKLITTISDGTTDYWYWVDARKVVHFEVQGVTQVAPWNIDVSDLSDANVLMQVSLTTTREKFANACWADIGAAKGLSTLTQTFVGDGNARSFSTQFPISSVVSLTKIINNTITQTLTNIQQEALITGQTPQNPAVAWYYSLNQNTLTEDPANPTLPASSGGSTYLLQIVYTPSSAIVEQFSNTASFAARQLVEGGSGESDLYVNLGNTNAVLANATVAQNEATYYAQMTQKLAIVTYRGGLQSGMGIVVNLPNIRAVGLFIVDTVQIVDENGYWKWTVGCSSGAIVGDWKKAMVSLANLL